jgi:carboxyl-terminal processing protease
MNNPKLKIVLPLLLSISMCAGIFIGFKMRDGFPDNSFFSKDKNSSINEVMELIKNKYVDDVSFKQISDTAIDAILSKLDPHSVRIPAAELQDVNDDINGNFYGIGIEFEIIDDTLNVTNVIQNGPAYNAGIEFSDKFIKANNIKIAAVKMSSDSIRKIICGSQGRKLKIDIIRKGNPLSLNIKRDLIPVNSIDASYMIDNETGYIKIDKFTAQTYREFMTALMELKKQGLKKMILDLRGNGGGVLDEAIEIADEFLDGDKLITYTIGKHSPKKEYRCRRLGQFETGKLIVLSDEESASASEVLMGALQDWDRATIIGRRSFGKGLVQEQFDLSDNSALRITIARYYSPLGRSIQRSYANGEMAYYKEIFERKDDQSEITEDSIRIAHAKKYKTPAGKILIDGGGIYPDIYSNSDTSSMSKNTIQLFTNNVINKYVFNYATAIQNIKSNYKNAFEFNKNYHFNSSDWDNIKNMSNSAKVDISNITPYEKDFIETTIKSRLARLVWDKNGMYEVINASDKTYKKACEFVNQ